MSMPLTYPGVYIQELPSAVHTIAGVATSIAAFVGYTPFGIDNRAEVIFSFADFERQFGGLASNSELSYAVQQFYQNGGSQAYVVRVPMHGATPASVAFGGLTFTALSSGAWANGQLLIDVDVLNINLTPAPSGDPLAFNLTITDLLHQTSESFPNVTLDPSARNYVETVVNDPDNGSQLVNISAPIPPPTTLPTTPVAVTGIVGEQIRLGNVNSALGGNYTVTTVSQPVGSNFIGFGLDFNTSQPSGMSPLPVTVNVFPMGTPIPQSVGGLATQLQQAINNVLTVQMPGASVRCSVTQVAATPPTANTASIAAPTGLSVTPSSSGGSFAAGSYFWVVTARNPNGETLRSNEVSATLSGTTGSAALSWTEVIGASGYKVYRGTAPGAEDFLIQTISSGATVTYTDNGTSGSAGKPPSTPTAVINAPSGLAVTPSSSGGNLPAGPTSWVVTALTTAGETTPSSPKSATLTGSSSSASLSWSADKGALSYNVYRGSSPGGEKQLVVNVSSTSVVDTGSIVTSSALRVNATLPQQPDAVVTFGPPSSGSGLGDASDALGLKSSLPPLIQNVAHYALGTGHAYASSVPGGETTASGPGSDGTTPPTLPNSQDLIGDPAQFTGIYALQKVDLFNLLSIPDATRALPSSPTTPDSSVDPVQIYSSAIQLCDARRAFLLVDPPPNITTVTGAVDWKSSGLGITDSNGAAFWPKLRVPDALNNGNLRSFAPSGVVAGVYATIDGSRGVWKAPAGIEATLGGVRSMTYLLSDPEQGLLNPLGLNCFRTFPVYGRVLWGARTLAGADVLASQWKYVPVRRMALFLEESLYRGTKWVVFEPNDEPLWAAIRLNIGAFMQTYFLKGAFQGQTPDQAYFVKCDRETTTQTDIDNGIVNILVGFAPLQPAEFVVIKIEQLTGQGSS